MKEPRQPCSGRIAAVTLGEQIRTASDAQAMRVAMLLTQMIADAVRQFNKGCHYDVNRERKTRSRFR